MRDTSKKGLQMKKEDSLMSILVTGLFQTIGWTIVYYVAIWAALFGFGGLAVLVQKMKEKNKK